MPLRPPAWRSPRGEPCGSGLEGVYPGQRGEEGTGPERAGSNGEEEAAAAARGGCAVNRESWGRGGGSWRRTGLAGAAACFHPEERRALS